jgi:hypothetical protein
MLEEVEDRLERAFYRIRYPVFLRPTLLIGAERFVVVDVSERGLRFLATGSGPPPGAVVVARLSLLEMSPIEVEGTVVRREGGHVALVLARGVPFAVILDQQRLLQQRIWI